jgi:hypothetical protein
MPRPGRHYGASRTTVWISPVRSGSMLTVSLRLEDGREDVLAEEWQRPPAQPAEAVNFTVSAVTLVHLSVSPPTETL